MTSSHLKHDQINIHSVKKNLAKEMGFFYLGGSNLLTHKKQTSTK
jgi:hypothetical protein